MQITPHSTLYSLDLLSSLSLHCTPYFTTQRTKKLTPAQGFQVPPAELEGVINQMPDVLDCIGAHFHAIALSLILYVHMPLDRCEIVVKSLCNRFTIAAQT
jgi:hypothetical protein